MGDLAVKFDEGTGKPLPDDGAPQDVPGQAVPVTVTDPDYESFIQWKAAQAAQAAKDKADNAPVEWYVWLANGDVVRVPESDFPVSLNAASGNGHFEKDGNVYLVVGVYPTEDKAAK